MTRAEMLTELRLVLDDVVLGNYAWSDPTLIGYLSEGQDKFCEETGYFRDTTNYTVTLDTNVAVYDINDRIIQVINVWDGNRRLGKIIQDEELVDDEWPSTWDMSTTGPPTHWTTDKDTGVIEFYPTPTADYDGRVLTLQVWRYSRYDLAGLGAVPEGGGQAPPAAPEIPSRFQRACIEWAASKARNHKDMDTYDSNKVVEHEANFWKYVSDGRTQFRRHHNIETRVGTNSAYRT